VIALMNVPKAARKRAWKSVKFSSGVFTFGLAKLMNLGETPVDIILAVIGTAAFANFT
jgi:hypothetical protein